MTSSREFTSTLDQMANRWGELGRTDPFAASCPRIGSGDEKAFAQSGLHLFEHHLAALWQRAVKDQDPGQARLLDLGCGAGRLVPALHATGALVHGLDIAETMLLAARRHVGPVPRLVFHKGDGMTLQCVRRHKFQWILAIDLFAHLPDLLLRNYLLRQMAGRLAPDGLVTVELPSGKSESATALLDHTGLVQDELLPGSSIVGPLLVARSADA